MSPDSAPMQAARKPTPEQWLPPPPVTDAELMARAIYGQLLAATARHNGTQFARSDLVQCQRAARDAAAFYFADQQVSHDYQTRAPKA